MEKKDNKIYATYFDIKKACSDMEDKCLKFTGSWMELYQKGLTNILDALIENDMEKAKKALLDSINEIKESQIKKTEELGSIFADSITEAYSMAYAEGTRQAEHSVFTNLKLMVDEGDIPDPTGRLTYFLTELDKASAELFAKHTKGRNAILLFPELDDHVDNNKKSS